MRLAVFLLIVLVVRPAVAADRMVALVFGADRYATLRPLDNATGDAQAVAATLETLGFEVTLELDRDQRRMRRALDDFRHDGQGADVVLIFYAGHGVEIGGTNRLLPTDTSTDSLAALEASTLTLDEVRAAATAVAPVALILLDACREDPFAAAGAEGRGGARLPKDIADAVRPGLGRMGEASNTLFAFAAGPGAVASDGTGEHSPFTEGLTRYLGTEGLEIRSVLTLVQQEVYDRTGGAQLPYVENGLPALFFAGTSAGELPERERLLLAMAGLTPDLRAEVERIAAEMDVPLAPLYGALVIADLGSAGLEQRSAELAEAARAFAETRDRLQALESADPEVAALRSQAEDQLALGAFGEARSLLDRAIELDRASRGGLRSNLLARTLSEAASLVARAGIDRTALDHPAAIASLQEAAALYDEIEGFGLSPDDWFQRETLLGDLAQLHRVVGDAAAALAANERLYRAMLVRQAAFPDDQVAKRAVSVSLDRVGDARIVLGDFAGALVAYEESLRITEEVVAADPSLVLPRRDLSISHIKLGDVALERGDVDGAAAAYQSALDAVVPLITVNPGDDEVWRDIMIGHTRLADALRAAGRADSAMGHYQTGLGIATGLAARAPGKPEPQRDLALEHGKIGDMRAASGDPAGALAAYQLALAISTDVAGTDPLNTLWQRDLSVTSMQVGDALMALDRHAEALAAFRAGLAITEALVARDPGNTGWQRDLSINWERVGDGSVMAGDIEAARAAFGTALDIHGKLAATDPDNALWQRDLVIAHYRMSLVADDPRAHLEAALAIALALDARGQLAPADAFIPAFLREAIAQVE